MKIRFKAKVIDLFSRERAVVVSSKDAENADLRSFDRVKLTADETTITAMLYLSDKLTQDGTIRVSQELASDAGITDGDIVSVALAPRPQSVTLIKRKMTGATLSKADMGTIIQDIVRGNIGPMETLAFAMAQKYLGMNDDETEFLTRALVDTGDALEFDSPAYDKHSIGGVPGNKVSLLIVPIVASAGLLIPKTSSRAITSPTGTADTMEVLAQVEFTASELKEIARKTNGAIAWGGMLNLAPGDDMIIRAESVVGIDPESQMLASILAKKMAAGVRNLERHIAAACRAVATDIASNQKRRATIGKRKLTAILGPAEFESELALRTGIPGVATALAYTPVGGELLFIESASMPGKGQLQLTGQIGDVMKESAQAAFSIVKANAAELKIDPERFSKHDYHIHVPAGAIPKDGPSAGVAMFTSLVSLLLDRSTRPEVAMTGEITLRGLVLPVGGLKEKILAAKQAGIKTVILPARNQKDIPEVPKEAKKGLEFKFVKETSEVLKLAINTG